MKLVNRNLGTFKSDDQKNFKKLFIKLLIQVLIALLKIEISHSILKNEQYLNQLTFLTNARSRQSYTLMKSTSFINKTKANFRGD